MVLCVLGLLLFGFGTETEVPAAPPGPVVLLVEDDTGAFLLQVKQGAQQAAAQAGCTLTQEPLSGKTLAETAQRWSQRKATAALLLTEDAVLRADAEAALDAVGVPVVVLRDEETRTVYAAMDERQAGMLLADFAKAYGRVYLVGDAPQRLEGALSALTQEQAVTEGNALPAPGEDACVAYRKGDPSTGGHAGSRGIDCTAGWDGSRGGAGAADGGGGRGCPCRGNTLCPGVYGHADGTIWGDGSMPATL